MVRPRLRVKLPPAIEAGARATYVGVGMVTVPLRLQPSFLMVGASRSGTTSLFRALSGHPSVVRPAVNKGVRYFDLNYAHGHAWYAGHFPLRAAAQLAARPGSGPVITFEASGYYLFHPSCPPRIARDLPGVKIVVMLRDPVERAYSAWKHESARGFEWEPFERSLQLEGFRLHGELERIERDPTYESFCHRHHSHRSRGEYIDQIERYLQHIPRKDVHVIVSEEFFRHPARVFAALLDFLELPQHRPERFEQHNARPSEPMPRSARRLLENHYLPYNHRLEELLQRPLPWG